MAILKALDFGRGRKGYRFWCPGCEMNHAVATEGGEPVWSFNNDPERPTFGPSIRVRHAGLCHSYVEAGKIRFLSDSTHGLAGQEVPLPDLDALAL